MIYFVFDVEAPGLHRTGFAVGYVVVDSERLGVELSADRYYCDLATCDGTEAEYAWVQDNVKNCDAQSSSVRFDSPAELRTGFWYQWKLWQRHGAVLAADVTWPVESNFLTACIRDDVTRCPQGPYPLLDVASVRLGAGLDPLASEARLPTELPAHDPLADARQSARLLLEALRVVPDLLHRDRGWRHE